MTQTLESAKRYLAVAVKTLSLVTMSFCFIKKGCRMIQGYYSVQELSNKWNLGERQIQQMCAVGKIPGAVKFGRSWAIPCDAERPVDKRITTGEYINWRNHLEKTK